MRIQRSGGLLVPALTFLMLLLALIPRSARAQVPALSQGSLIVGGSAGLDVTDTGEGDNVTSIAITPHVERFVRDGLAVGGDVLLGRSSQGDASLTTVGVGPVVAYYFGDEDTTHPFVRGGVRWLHASSDFGGGSSSQSTTGLHASAGLLLLLSDAVGVETALYWEHNRYKPDGGSTFNTDRYGLKAGVSAFVF
jgi:hypothetical protein